MRKVISMLLILVITLAGCGSGSGEFISEGDDKLTVWGFYEGAPKVAVDYYEQQTGTPIEYITIGWDDYQTKLNTVLGTSEAPDIVLLERSFLGSYLPTENFVAFEDFFTDTSQLETYETNTAIATAGPGQVDGATKAIGWENSASMFTYRVDLAEQCFGWESYEDAEAATPDFESYYDLQIKLDENENEDCQGMSLLQWPDFQTGLLQETGVYEVDTENGTYTIPSEFGDVLEEIKFENESGMVYSPSADKTQITAGNMDNQTIGSITQAWGVQALYEYDQPGLWAIAESPLKYTAGGTLMAATTNADADIVEEFLNMTMLNEQWLIDNMDEFGMIGNETLMNKYLEDVDAGNPYFQDDQNIVKKLSEINSEITYYTPATPYDSGIGTSIDEVVAGFAIDGTIATTDEAKEQLKDKINSLYPDLEVIVE